MSAECSLASPTSELSMRNWLSPCVARKPLSEVATSGVPVSESEPQPARAKASNVTGIERNFIKPGPDMRPATLVARAARSRNAGPLLLYPPLEGEGRHERSE